MVWCRWGWVGVWMGGIEWGWVDGWVKVGIKPNSVELSLVGTELGKNNFYIFLGF